MNLRVVATSLMYFMNFEQNRSGASMLQITRVSALNLPEFLGDWFVLSERNQVWSGLFVFFVKSGHNFPTSQKRAELNSKKPLGLRSGGACTRVGLAFERRPLTPVAAAPLPNPNSTAPSFHVLHRSAHEFPSAVTLEEHATPNPARIISENDWRHDLLYSTSLAMSETCFTAIRKKSREIWNDSERR